ncbi:MAG: hypothetical protein II887_01940 [Bacteroidales bacterium]|nr:hypothetical protein [Bacteroidales bacterium]
MKKLHFIILAAMLAFVSCGKKAEEVNVELVTVENEVKTIGSTQAYFECEYEYLNEITKALLVYCEDDQLKYAQTSKLEQVGDKWVTQINYLEKSTKYYYRYEFYNGYNLMWTEIFNFTTSAQQDKPTVETVGVDNITMITATVEGNVINDGGSAVTERGICYSIYENPTLSDSIRRAGTGIGRFTCEMTNLTNATTYYIRAFATNSEGTSYGEVVTMRTVEHPMLATVTTDEVSDITINTAVCGGNVLNDGFAEVTERGICYATHQEPTVFDYKVAGGEGLGLFQCRMSGLEMLTTYYVRAYAKNNEGYAYGNEVSFVTADETYLPEVITYEVTDFNHFYAMGGGEVVADGGLDILRRGICWSTSHNPTIYNNTLTAGGGMGSFECRMSYLYGNTTYYVRAFAANEAGVAYGNEVTFTTSPHPNTAPEGAIPALFSISETQQVFFSKGNLQYQASTGTWRFAEHQWDYVGGSNNYGEEYGNVYESGVKCSNNEISQSYSGWIDLFGWATSGWNNNNHYYQPWDTENTGWTVNGYGYGYWDGEYANYSMEGDYINMDWGVYNAISNGGNEAGLWRTGGGDIYYIVNSRQNHAYLQSDGTVNGVQGKIILPDAWILPEGVSFLGSAGNYDINTYSIEEWEIMENAGAVFLPNAGYRYEYGGMRYDTYTSYYWCRWYDNNGTAGAFELSSYSYPPRYYGCSVRLVQNY